jgi:hypothetical protein
MHRLLRLRSVRSACICRLKAAFLPARNAAFRRQRTAMNFDAVYSPRRWLAGVALVIATLACAPALPADIELALRTREPGSDRTVVTPQKIDPRKIGIVIVDMWNYHWCMTWSEQAGGMYLRMNRALEGARKLGMTVLWAPTDVAAMYAGTPQRERALATAYVPLPKVREYRCRFTMPYGACHCGPGIPCVINYGHDGMHPGLVIAPDDFIVSGTQELYSLCRARGLTQLLYLGGAVNICLTGKPEGLKPMYEAGLDGWVARDLVEAWTEYNPKKEFTPATGTALSMVDLERAGVPTINLAEELRHIGLWDDEWITEPVRITPSGTIGRPYFFEQSVAIALNTPWLEGAEIHYTLDGSKPAADSPHYEKPIVVTATTTLRTAAFKGPRRVSLEGSGYFVHLRALPPKPQVYLDELTATPDLYAKMSRTFAACVWQPSFNQSYQGKPLRVRTQKYEHGLGMRAPAYARFDIKPQYKRFVALAGIDDNMLDDNLGRNVAMYPSVTFKVFLDGALAAESPVMRISQVPWRFDVPIPSGTRQISLAVMDSGTHSPFNLANWVEAGFIQQ